MRGGVETHGGILDLDRRRDAHRQKEEQRCAQRQLDQGLSFRLSHRLNPSLSSTTLARIGMPLPGTIGTRDGTDPPTSTLNAEPRSVAQIHNIGWRWESAGHHTAAPAPTSAAEIVRSATRAATSVPAPTTVPAPAPARAASRAAAD